MRVTSVTGPQPRWSWLILAQCCGAAAASIFLASGSMTLGFVVALLPIQAVAFGVAISKRSGLLMLLTALFPLAGLELLPNKYFLSFLYPVIIAMQWFMLLVREPPSPSRPPLLRAESWPLVGLILVTVGSAVHSVLRGWSSEFLVYYTVVAVEVFALAYLFAAVPSGLREIERLLFVFAGVTLLQCALLPVLTLSSGATAVLGGKIIEGPFGSVNLNAFAAYVNAAAAVLLAYLDTRRLSLASVLHWLASAVAVVALLLTQSRAAWMGFGAAVLYVLFRRRSMALALGCTVGLAALMSFDVVGSAVGSRVGQTRLLDPSLIGRVMLWQSALHVGSVSPIVGVGMENFRYVKHLYGFPSPLAIASKYNTHSLFLEFYVGLGVTGLGLLLMLIIGTFRRLDRIARGRHERASRVGVAVNAALVAYAVHGLLDALTWQHGAFVVLGMLLGLGSAARRVARQDGLTSV